MCDTLLKNKSVVTLNSALARMNIFKLAEYAGMMLRSIRSTQLLIFLFLYYMNAVLDTSEHMKGEYRQLNI